MKERLDASHRGIDSLAKENQQPGISRARRYTIVAGAIVLVAALISGWWWSTRQTDTIYMEAAIVIQETKHFTEDENGACQGTRPGYRGGNEVVVKLESGEEHSFVMEPGVVESSMCRLTFSGDIPVSDTYTARVGRYETYPLDRGPNTRLVGTGETGEKFLKADFIADPWDPWAGDT